MSAGLYGIGSGIDIVMTPGAVRAYNRNEGNDPDAFKVRIGATAVPGGGGLALGGRF